MSITEKDLDRFLDSVQSDSPWGKRHSGLKRKVWICNWNQPLHEIYSLLERGCQVITPDGKELSMKDVEDIKTISIDSAVR